MRILYVTDPNTPLSKVAEVGATLMPYELAKGIVKRGVDVDWLVVNDTGSDNVEGINIINLRYLGRLYQKKLYEKILSIIDDYDLVHVNVSTPGFVKYLNKFESKHQYKIVFTMHTWTNSLAVSYYYKDDYRKLIEDSNVTVVCITESQRDMLFKKAGATPTKLGMSRFSIINNAVDEVEECIPADQREDYIVAVGRCVASKGIDKIITGCINSNQKLYLVSPYLHKGEDSVYSDGIDELIESAPEGLIHREHSLPHDELMKVIAKAKAGVLYSTFDVFSMFLLECVMKHTKVYALRSGSTAEVVDMFSDDRVEGFDNYKQFISLLSKPCSVDDTPVDYFWKFDRMVQQYLSLYEIMSRFV